MTNRIARRCMASTLGLGLAAASGAARADELVVPNAHAAASADAALPPPANWSNYNVRPLTPAARMLTLHGDLVSNISQGNGGKPVWITPNIFYGVTDRFSLGIVENPQAEFLATGGGLCLGTNAYCTNVLNYVGPTSLMSFLRTAAYELAGHVGLDYELSPSQVGVRAGALMKLAVAGPLAVMTDPSITAGITRRNDGNKEFLYVPVRVGVQANPQVNFGLVAGVNGPLDGSVAFIDAYAIPIGVTVLASPDEKLDVGASFIFLNLAGKRAAGVTATDGRTIALTVNYRI